MSATLDAWRALLDRPLASLRAQVDEGRIRDGVHYGAAGPLTSLSDRAFFPGTVYYDAGQPVLVYVEMPATRAEDLTDEDLLALAGDDAARLRSRAGKTARLHVAAERGVAIAVQGGKVAYLELFEPMTLEQYRERIYAEPRPFTR